MMGVSRTSAVAVLLSLCAACDTSSWPSRALTVDTAAAKTPSADIAQQVRILAIQHGCQDLSPDVYDKFNKTHYSDYYKCRDDIYVVVWLSKEEVFIRLNQEGDVSLEAEHLYSDVYGGLQSKWPSAVRKVSR